LKNHYEIINVNLTSIQNDEPVSEVDCGDCTLCCQLLAPLLTVDEIRSGKYPISLTNPSPSQIAENPQIGPLVTLYRKPEGGCGMFVDGKCSIYEERPLACRQFDCRKGHNPALVDHAKGKFNL
jgi:Fe-S-cluster containining protein